MGNNYTNNPPTYKGEMQNGKKHGKGIYLFPNGERYEGEWANDQINGQGTFYFSDGSNHQVNIRTVSLTVKEFLHLNQEQSTKVCSKMEIQLT